jgi:hypothetical protein
VSPNISIAHQYVKGVRGLDLSTSLIPSWDLIALIAAELPALRRLSLKSVISNSCNAVPIHLLVHQAATAYNPQGIP